jgi:hypothetical protein
MLAFEQLRYGAGEGLRHLVRHRGMKWHVDLKSLRSGDLRKALEHHAIQHVFDEE